MECYLGIILVAVMLAYVQSINKNRILKFKAGNIEIFKRNIGYDISFFLVFLWLAFFSAARDGIGIDYNSYIHHIKLIQNGRPHYMEFGFKKFVILLSKISINPRFIIIIIGILTVFLFVKAIWEQSDNVAESVFLFLALGYYFLTYNTVRNYFALAIIIYSIRFLKNEKKMFFILGVLLAATIHKSALVCIPIYLVSNIKWKRIYYVWIAVTTFFLLVSYRYIRMLVFVFYPGYENTAYDVERISYYNIIKGLIVILVCLMTKGCLENRQSRLFFHLNVFALVLYVGLFWLPEISRIGFYMNATSVLLIPSAMQNIKNTISRRCMKIIIYGMFLFMFVIMCKGFYSDTTQLLPYQSWIF